MDTAWNGFVLVVLCSGGIGFLALRLSWFFRVRKKGCLTVLLQNLLNRDGKLPDLFFHEKRN
jgi:hypothetical protein